MSKLTTRYIDLITKSGRFGDGKGLFLLAQGEGAGVRKSWMIRYTSPRTGQRRAMGLGSLDSLGLAKARARALALRLQIMQSIDPLDDLVSRKERVPHRSPKTSGSAIALSILSEFAYEFYDRHRITPRSEKYQRQWIKNLERLVLAKLGKRRMDSLTVDDFLSVLQPLALTNAETCRRVVIQLCMIFRDSMARDRITKDVMEKVKILIHYPSIVKKNQRCLSWELVPRLASDVVQHAETRESVKLAFIFALLTASRTSEVIGCVWGEFNLAEGVWNVPAERMKAFKEHKVYLSVQGIALLQKVYGNRSTQNQSDIVFQSPARGCKSLSHMAFLSAIKSVRCTSIP